MIRLVYLFMVRVVGWLVLLCPRQRPIPRLRVNERAAASTAHTARPRITSSR